MPNLLPLAVRPPDEVDQPLVAEPAQDDQVEEAAEEEAEVQVLLPSVAAQVDHVAASVVLEVVTTSFVVALLVVDQVDQVAESVLLLVVTASLVVLLVADQVSQLVVLAAKVGVGFQIGCP